ncbi:MAG: tol-pal system protein YbgF [Gammaproteobacteria bacterium]|nr:tol-pal system protein YbgF [Gammaproteobacteria bacterium]
MQGPAGAGPAQRPQSLEERVARIERQLDNQTLVDMYARLDALTQQVQELRGIIEEQAHNTQGVEQRQREIYLDFDRRLRQLETQLSGMQSSALPPLETPASPSSDSGDQAAYQQAVDALRAGRNQESITALQDFLTRYPESQYASNAQYWLGEANYVTKRYPEAVAEFEKVLKLYPDSNKVPDAMLKLGYSQYELGQADQASTTLKTIISKYPSSTASQLAQNRLQRMKTGGR